MKKKSVLITEELKEAINKFLGVKFIPDCAVGNEISQKDGGLILKTFQKMGIEGARLLEADGDITNLITTK